MKGENKLEIVYLPPGDLKMAAKSRFFNDFTP